jgi:hypothetical protein
MKELKRKKVVVHQEMMTQLWQSDVRKRLRRRLLPKALKVCPQHLRCWCFIAKLTDGYPEVVGFRWGVAEILNSKVQGTQRFR